MAVRRIVMFPAEEATLRKRSARIKPADDSTAALIADLKDTLLAHPGAGLAAPQIGVHKRVVVVRFGQDAGEMEPPRALVNPVILEKGPLTSGFDGCLSLPRVVTWDTLRPAWLRFRAQDEQGEPFEMRVEGIDAILVHHEIDHLNGKVFIDYLSPLKRRMALKKLEKTRKQAEQDALKARF